MRGICVKPICIILASLDVLALGIGETTFPKFTTGPLPPGIYQEQCLVRPEPIDDFRDLRGGLPYCSPIMNVTGDGKYLILGTSQPRLQYEKSEYHFYLIVYDISARTYSQLLRISHEGCSSVPIGFADIQITSDDRFVAVTWCDDVSLYELNKAKGKLEHRWTKVGDREKKLAPWSLSRWCSFSPDDARLFVACPDEPLLELQTSSGKPQRSLRYTDVLPSDCPLADLSSLANHSAAIRASPLQTALWLDNWVLVNFQPATPRQGILVCDIDSKKSKFLRLSYPPVFTGPVIRFQPGKDVVVVCYVAGHRRVTGLCLHLLRWEWKGDRVYTDILGRHWYSCTDLLFSPDGRYLLLLLEPHWMSDPNLLVLDTNNWKVVRGYRLKSGGAYRARFAHRANLLVLLSSDGHLVLMDWKKFSGELNCNGRPS